ncbi:hydrolase [Bradyrhizobium erythrophlei]|uniref:hydrolase n=1 Tax=Bradyrhizobium erythrophlei TaxID=1437360 RepID=UPI0035E6F2A9
MTPYEIRRGDPGQRQQVEAWLFGLDLVSEAVRERMVTGWISAWISSSHARLEDIPYALAAPGYQLARHVNEVTRTGIALARSAMEEWRDEFDFDVLVPILAMHDVDKPLMYVRDGEKVASSRLSQELPHGVVGAMLLKDLGFPHLVVSTVATHAANAPFHGRSLEAYVLHYADFFATDRTCMREGATPFYQRHWR